MPGPQSNGDWGSRLGTVATTNRDSGFRRDDACGNDYCGDYALGDNPRACDPRSMIGGFVSIMTNKPHGTLFIGVTADLAARVFQDRTGQGSVFCKRYNLIQLVWAEYSSTIEEAIAREKALKEWPRKWKLKLIHEANTNWDDLYESLNQ